MTDMTTINNKIGMIVTILGGIASLLTIACDVVEKGGKIVTTVKEQIKKED